MQGDKGSALAPLDLVRSLSGSATQAVFLGLMHCVATTRAQAFALAKPVPNQTARLGMPFALALSSAGVVADSANITVTGLPPWLTLDLREDVVSERRQYKSYNPRFTSNDYKYATRRYSFSYHEPLAKAMRLLFSHGHRVICVVWQSRCGNRSHELRGPIVHNVWLWHMNHLLSWMNTNKCRTPQSHIMSL